MERLISDEHLRDEDEAVNDHLVREGRTSVGSLRGAEDVVLLAFETVRSSVTVARNQLGRVATAVISRVGGS